MTTTVFINHFYEYLYPFSHNFIWDFLMNLKSIFTYIKVLKKKKIKTFFSIKRFIVHVAKRPDELFASLGLSLSIVVTIFTI